MRISTKLFLVTTALVVIVTVIAATSKLYSRRIETQLERAQQANALAYSIAEISLLSESYHAFKTSRVETQWYSRSERILADLDSANKVLPNIDSLQLLFNASIEAFEALQKLESDRRKILSAAPVQTVELERLQTLEDRVTARMRMNSQTLLSHVFTIAENAQQTVVKLQAQSSHIVTYLSLSLSLAAILFSVLLIQNLSRRLNALSQGAESIREGQLGKRVELPGQDELSLFAQAFNRMVQTLEDNYQQLQQSEDQFRTLIELAPEEIFIQQEGKIVYMNQAGLRLLGATSADQVVGKDVLDIVHPDDRNAVKQRMHAMKTGVLESVPVREERLVRLDGTSVFVEVVAARSTYEGQPAVQVFVRDISEKLMLQKTTERASRLAAIGTLAAGVAHEINNPNSVIMHNIPTFKAVWDDLGTLLDGHDKKHDAFMPGGIPYHDLREEMPLLLQDCVDCSQRIKRIVNDLKNFSQDTDASNSEAEPLADIDLNELADTASRLVINRIKTSTDHFSLDLSTEQPRSKGSFLRLEQVVINLLSNACQALTSPAQEIRLVTRHDKERGLNWIEVHDQGRGISEQEQQQILEPFFTTHRETGGTGLGLSISNTIIREHGGELIIFSKPGVGTCVKFSLPVVTTVDKS